MKTLTHHRDTARVPAGSHPRESSADNQAWLESCLVTEAEAAAQNEKSRRGVRGGFR
jgi:hypothetical protein